MELLGGTSPCVPSSEEGKTLEYLNTETKGSRGEEAEAASAAMLVLLRLTAAMETMQES